MVSATSAESLRVSVASTLETLTISLSVDATVNAAESEVDGANKYSRPNHPVAGWPRRSLYNRCH